MISVNNAKRLIKRAILANVATDKKDLFITPLISGKHGIGKSAIVKSVAEDLGGTCITIEGGTLKEGEITGLPYQYEDAQGAIKFRFLPHYAVDRIQAKECQIFEEMGAELGAAASAADVLDGDENRYALNGIPAQKRIELLQSGRIKPVIVFIDEVNRTENTVYKELMNILLTKTVNGYRFPWWVFFVGAMNPSTQNSAYATNEMDPAQLDRFLKLKVDSKPGEWIRYGRYPQVHKGAPQVPLRGLKGARGRGEAHALPAWLGHGRYDPCQRANAQGFLLGKGERARRRCPRHEGAGLGKAWHHGGNHVLCQPRAA